jgi:hypothetical protein
LDLIENPSLSIPIKNEEHTQNGIVPRSGDTENLLHSEPDREELEPNHVQLVPRKKSKLIGSMQWGEGAVCFERVHRMQPWEVLKI